ncbi:MAG: MBL fold metallo-hydrolase [Pseudomonadota bacterium]
MTDAPAVRLTVWGAGGSAPTGDPSRTRWGGDTVCFELRLGGAAATPLIIDMGSGARQLGRALWKEAEAAGRSAAAEVLLSHFHLDHVIGLPFFAPFYDPEAHVTVHAGTVGTPAELERTVSELCSAPFFPIRPLDMGAARFRCFVAGQSLEVAGFEVTPFETFHPGGCCGFRIATPHGVVCIVGDHEHGDARIDAIVREMVEGADLMIFDATYDDETYDAHAGWGHSTWQKGVALAEAAGVGQVLMHHHQPEHDDDALDARDARIRAAAPDASLARQGQVLMLKRGALSEA